MSHFSEVKTKIRDENILKHSLKKMGFQVVEAEQNQGVQVRGYMGDTQKADFKILTQTHYDIGFLKNSEGCFELVGDWELMPKVAQIDQNVFTRTLKREYAHQTILKVAAEKGYTLEYLNQESDEMQIVVKQWSS